MITFLEVVYYAVSIPVGAILVLQILGVVCGILFGGLAEECMPDAFPSQPPVEKSVPEGLDPERSSGRFQIDDDFGF